MTEKNALDEVNDPKEKQTAERFFSIRNIDRNHIMANVNFQIGM